MDRALQRRPPGLPGARREPFPLFLVPMMAVLDDRPFNDPRWLFEPKLDGVRVIALLRRGAVNLLSRRGLEISAQYPLVTRDLAKQPLAESVFDGEIVALDGQGRPSFQRLQGRMNLIRGNDIRRAEEVIPVIYYVFDLLYLEGYDLRSVPLDKRKEALARVLVPSEHVKIVEHFPSDGEAAYDAALTFGLEGIIAKRRNSAYTAGRRSRDWLKIKATLSEDFVVGGYTQGAGRRSEGFGALLVGYYDNRGALRYAGHVGTGFDESTVRDLRAKLDAIRSGERPFATQPPLHAPATWVRPELVAEVKFAEFTQDGNLRAPSFVRLRPDVAPAEVQRSEFERLLARPTTSPIEPKLNPVQRDAAFALDQLERPGNSMVIQVKSHEVSLNNLDKEMWPAHRDRRALTKRDLIVYLCKVAPYLLPHMRDRPLTLLRYPHGVTGGRFFQKHWASPLPDFVETVRLFSEQVNEDQEYLICNNLATLLWLGQIADLELHCWLARISLEPDARQLSTRFTGSEENIEGSVLNYPDFIAFDLDPFIYSGKEQAGAEPELNREAFDKACQAAYWLRDVLDSLSLKAFVKTSGVTGLHIYVPVRRQLSYDQARAASGTIAKFLLQEHPRDITTAWQVVRRTGKVLVDYNQNTRGKTLATIYSPRSILEATISMPVSWDGLADIYPTDFTILTAPDLIPVANENWVNILEAKQDLSAIL